MANNVSDYSQNIALLVDVAIKAADGSRQVYLGRFHGFDLFTSEQLLWLTHSELTLEGAKNLFVYLRNNNLYVSGVSMRTTPYAEGSIFISPSLDVDRVTRNKEKFESELENLAGLLKSYRILTARQ